jgi:hypothetical protein
MRTQTFFTPAVFNPFMLWADFAMKAMEMLVSSGQVIGTRVDQMARAGHNPSARDIKEFALMGSEKMKAATESSLAVATRMQAANVQLLTRGWQQWFQAMSSPTMALAAIKPFHGGATANARRLARRRLSTKRGG